MAEGHVAMEAAVRMDVAVEAVVRMKCHVAMEAAVRIGCGGSHGGELHVEGNATSSGEHQKMV